MEEEGVNVESVAKKRRLDTEADILDTFHNTYREIPLLQKAIEGLVFWSIDEKSYPIRRGGKLVQNFSLLNCNATDSDPKPFEEASCSVQDHDCFPYGALFLEGLTVLDDFLVKKLKPESELLQKILACLLTFLMDSDSQRRLNKEEENSNCPEGVLTAIIANHFLLKLSPATRCTLDKSSVENILENSRYPRHPQRKRQHLAVRVQRDEPHKILTCCPCDEDGNCQLTKEIALGDTSIGNKSVWHGKFDCLFRGVAVQTREKGSDAPIDQLIAQAITFSFLRASQEPGLSFVPTIGVSAEDITIYFYDSKDDILLMSLTSSFSEPGQTRIEAILMVWLALNYQHLGCYLGDVLKSQTKCCNFVNLIGDKMDIFKNNLSYCVKCKERWKPSQVKINSLPSEFDRFKKN